MNMSGGGHTLADVTLDITVECADERGIRHEIDTVLGYRSSDPFAVAMTFITADGDLVWTFGRDLLDARHRVARSARATCTCPRPSASAAARWSASSSAPPTATWSCWPAPPTSTTSSPAPSPSWRRAPSRTTSTSTCSSTRCSTA